MGGVGGICSAGVDSSSSYPKIVSQNSASLIVSFKYGISVKSSLIFPALEPPGSPSSGVAYLTFSFGNSCLRIVFGYGLMSKW